MAALPVSATISVGGVLSLVSSETQQLRSRFVSSEGRGHSGETLVVIEPQPGWRLVNAGELWRGRELLFFLAWRDIKVRYKQTVLGALWALVQPLAAMATFTLFLRRVAAQPDATVPYGLFVYAGMLPWMFFAKAIGTAASSVVNDQNLVTKIYFPRLIIPMSAIAGGLVDFVIALGVLVVMMAVYRVAPGWGLLALPLLVGLLIVAALGVGNLLSALTVAYRDFNNALPFMTQLWMFATPGIYLQAQNVFSARVRSLVRLNPVQGLVVNFRAAVLGGSFDLPSLTTAAVISLGLLLIGCLCFRRMERTFADII
jgi:lipopolysaccharide transport system permease protein